MSGLAVAVLGARGAVGREMWRLLEASDLPVGEIRAYGTARSEGVTLPFRGEGVRCHALTQETFRPADLVLASAGATASRAWSPRFVEAGAVVVDNSSAYRGDPSCPLVIPEVNGHVLGAGCTLVANPNCSTIQMVVALWPLHRRWRLRAVRVSTYQSVSGAGARAMEELTLETRAHVELREAPPPGVLPHAIAFNVIPQVGTFDARGESQEEVKMRQETRRLLALPQLAVSATCVRVPVYRGHSEAVWASFEETPDAEEARHLLEGAGVRVEDRPQEGLYPLPVRAAGTPDVYAGRIRIDAADPRGLCMWVVSDNLLKGAAANAFQIARHMIAQGWVPRGAHGS